MTKTPDTVTDAVIEAARELVRAFGGDPPDWLCGEVYTLERALAAADAAPAPDTATIPVTFKPVPGATGYELHRAPWPSSTAARPVVEPESENKIAALHADILELFAQSGGSPPSQYEQSPINDGVHSVLMRAVGVGVLSVRQAQRMVDPAELLDDCPDDEAGGGDQASRCEECERSHGPHYRGPCEHVRYVAVAGSPDTRIRGEWKADDPSSGIACVNFSVHCSYCRDVIPAGHLISVRNSNIFCSDTCADEALKG
jgi:hypothetical protein